MVEGNEGVGMPVGERLRRARLERGLSLDDVSRDTKIQAWILDAIERDEISRVPGGIFIRGYLTSYARTVLLDPGEVLAAYSTEHPVPMEPPPPAPEPPRPTGAPLWQMAVIAVAIVTVAFMWRSAARTQSDALQDGAVGSGASLQVSRTQLPRQSSREDAQPAATAGSSVPAAAVERTPDTSSPLLVELHITGEAWIEASADGERKVYRLVDEGETVRLEGQKQIRLLVGDAGAVRYTINGQPARPLGSAGDVRSVVISGETVGRLTNN